MCGYTSDYFSEQSPEPSRASSRCGAGHSSGYTSCPTTPVAGRRFDFSLATENRKPSQDSTYSDYATISKKPAAQEKLDFNFPTEKLKSTKQKYDYSFTSESRKPPPEKFELNTADYAKIKPRPAQAQDTLAYNHSSELRKLQEAQHQLQSSAAPAASVTAASPRRPLVDTRDSSWQRSSSSGRLGDRAATSASAPASRHSRSSSLSRLPTLPKLTSPRIVETEIWKKEIYKKVKIFSIPQKIFDENIYNFVIVAGDGGDCA